MNTSIQGQFHLPSALCFAALMLLGGAPASAQGVSLNRDIEELPIWSMSLQVSTCDVKNANSDGALFSRWSNYNSTPFYLDNPGDDRERNQWDEYDVTPEGVLRVKDIKRIQLETNSSDGWCVDEIRLYINDHVYPIFSKRISGGVWIDKDSSKYYKIFSGELRSNSWWTAETFNSQICDMPTYLGNATLENKAATLLGHMMADPASSGSIRDLYWGSGGVRISRRNASTLNFKASAFYEIDYFVDPKIEITSRIGVGCAFDSGEGHNVFSITPTSPNVNVDFPWYIDVLTLGLLDLVADSLVDGSIPSISDAITAETPICPASINVNDYGSVEIDWGNVYGVEIDEIEGALCADPDDLGIICAWLPDFPMC